MGARSAGQGQVRRSVAEHRKSNGSGRSHCQHRCLGHRGEHLTTAIAEGLVQLGDGQPGFIAELEAAGGTGIRRVFLVSVSDGRAGGCQRER